jgi:membrane associated rhomboid family serine protease
MTSADPNPANFCYRHPDRQSFVLCQRCGRTICGQCQTQAPVGVHCPECVREARQSAPRRAPAIVKAFRPSSTRPVVTMSIIALCVIVYIAQVVTGGALTNDWVYLPALTASEPWRMVTALFVHASVWHILANMYSLFVIGPMLERLLGRARFLALYLLSGFGGSVAVLLIAPASAVLGASGAIFGLLGALFVIQRKLGGNMLQLVIVIGINLAIGFFLPFIAWQAHVGGLIVGAGVGVAYLQTRRPAQRNWQIGILIAITAALIAVTVVAQARL